MHFIWRTFLILIFVLVLLSTPGGYAQKKLTFNAGVENSFPFGNFKNYYTFGIGPSAGIDYRIAKPVTIYFAASYLTYFINSKNLDVTGSEIFLPMLIGTKIYVIPKLYILAGGGVNLDFGNVVTPYHVFHFGIGKTLFKKLSVEIKYERTGNFDFTPKVMKIRLAYIF